MSQFIPRLACITAPAFGGGGSNAVRLATAALPWGRGQVQGKETDFEKNRGIEKNPPIKLEFKLEVINCQYRWKMLAHFVI